MHDTCSYLVVREQGVNLIFAEYAHVRFKASHITSTSLHCELASVCVRVYTYTFTTSRKVMLCRRAFINLHCNWRRRSLAVGKTVSRAAATMDQKQKLHVNVDITSDVICPW